MKNKFLLLVFFLVTFSVQSATYYSRASGAWGTAGNWSTVGCGGAAAFIAPGAADIVIICNGHVITVAANAACTSLSVSAGGSLTFSGDRSLTISGLTTVTGTVTTVNSGGAAATNTLQCNGNVTINSGGLITNNGQFNMANSTIFTINNGGTYTHNPENVTAANATMFNRTGATNTFGATSTIIMNAWHSGAIPLGQYAPSFGHITFSAGLVWNQDGTFSPNKIKGNVLSTNGQINFDDGTGLTTVLTIDGSVTTSGTAGIIFAQGANRNLTLTTGAVTHNGGSLMSCMYQTHGNLIWKINGTATFNKDFTAIQGAATPVTSSSSITVTGDFNIGGTSLFDINRGLTGTTSPATLNVTGNSVWNPSGWIRFIDGGNGDLVFTTNSLASSGSGKVTLKMALNTTVITGNVNLNCTNNFGISLGNRFYIYGGDGAGALGSTATTGNGTNAVALTVGGIFSLSSNANNTFYAMDLSGASSGGTLTANFGAIDFQGGTMIFHNANHSLGGVNTVSVTNTFNCLFSNAGDQVILINNISAGAGPVYNNVQQNIIIGGNLTLSGNTTGATFRGSASSGVQNVNIAGNFNMGGGTNSRFTSGSLGHALTVAITGNVNVTAGDFWYSYRPGTVTSSVNGNMAVSSGSLAIKGDIGASTHLVNGNYSQTGGLFSLYHDDAKAINMTNVITMTINGTFSETGGILNYDNRALSTANHVITLFGTSYTFGGTGIINSNNGVLTSLTNTGAVGGEFYFARTGTTTYANTAAPAATHFLQNVKQFVNTVTTVDASASTQPFLISSNSVQNNIAGTGANWALNVNGILNMGAGTISSFPSVTAYFSGIRVNANARLRTSNTAGFYDGTTSACLQPQVFSGNTSFQMDYNLDALSTVEYYASANQVVTGKFPNAGVLGDVALATAPQYHYGYLDINNLGTLGTNFAFPAVPAAGTGNVFVRTSLILTQGELNLAGSGTGQTINIENGAIGGITRNGITTTGYIKSEEQNAGDNRAKVMWYMGTNTGAHIYPFAFTAGAANYVPFTFDKTSAVASNITVSTRATAANDNLPWAAAGNVAAVSNMGSNMGNYPDASVPSVIDRWWDINASATTTANVTFSYRGAENTTTLSPTGNFGAQHWGGTVWDPPVGSAVGVTTGVGSLTASGLSTFSPWILASLSAILPIELLSFKAVLKNEDVILDWETSSEKNNDFFTVERSLNATDFTAVGVVKGAGNSASSRRYNFIDKTPPNGILYYRLRQTDFNKQSKVSEIVMVVTDDNYSVNIFPNPSSGEFNMEIISEKGSVIEYEVSDALGRSILLKRSLSSDNLQVEKIQLEQKGVYFLRITINDNVEYKKVIKR